MKTAAIAATAILALLVAGVAATAYAHPFTAVSTSQTGSSTAAAAHTDKPDHGDNRKGHDKPKGPGNPLNLTVGQTLTLSGLTGRYTSATNSSVKGNASGTLAVQITAAFKDGYLVTLTSGTIKLDATTYTVTSGTVELNPSGQSGTGTGSTSSSGQFLIHLDMHGTSTSPNGRAVLDLKVGGSEYLVSLGTPHPSDSDSD